MEILQVNEDQQKKLATVLKNFRIQLFEYIVDEDKLVVYDDKFHIKRTVTDYMSTSTIRVRFIQMTEKK